MFLIVTVWLRTDNPPVPPDLSLVPPCHLHLSPAEARLLLSPAHWQTLTHSASAPPSIPLWTCSHTDSGSAAYDGHRLCRKIRTDTAMALPTLPPARRPPLRTSKHAHLYPDCCCNALQSTLLMQHDIKAFTFPEGI